MKYCLLAKHEGDYERATSPRDLLGVALQKKEWRPKGSISMSGIYY
jgi:hypothetical protein